MNTVEYEFQCLGVRAPDRSRCQMRLGGAGRLFQVDLHGESSTAFITTSNTYCILEESHPAKRLKRLTRFHPSSAMSNPITETDRLTGVFGNTESMLFVFFPMYESGQNGIQNLVEALTRIFRQESQYEISMLL